MFRSELQDDYVIGMLCTNDENEDILVVSEKGFGKRSQLKYEPDKNLGYRPTHRGGKGVTTMKVTDKTGGIIALTNVTDDNDLMIINRSGVTIRMHVSDLRIMGRNTQGVKLINLRGKDSIASITKVDAEPDADDVEPMEGEEMTQDVALNVGTEQVDNTESSDNDTDISQNETQEP